MTLGTTTRLDPTAYDDAGTGEPALLCLPGWCGSRRVFAPVAARTAARRRTLTLDLPEHGDRPRTGADVGLADVVRDAVDLLDDRGVEQVVPVALSHAGWAAVELRRRLGPERVPAIVLVDWMPLGPPPGFLDALAGLQHERSWHAVRAQLFAMWTTGLDIPALQDYVCDMGGYGFEHWSRAGREIAASFAIEGSPLAALAALETPCPTLHVYAQPADDGFLAAQRGFAADHPWFTARRLAARSHFPMFEVADELSAAIEGHVCRL